MNSDGAARPLARFYSGIFSERVSFGEIARQKASSYANTSAPPEPLQSSAETWFPWYVHRGRSGSLVCFILFFFVFVLTGTSLLSPAALDKLWNIFVHTEEA